MAKLRYDRVARGEHRRVRQLVRAEFNHTGSGMDHGIILFGAIRRSQEMVAAYCTRILSQPLLTRIA